MPSQQRGREGTHGAVWGTGQGAHFAAAEHRESAKHRPPSFPQFAWERNMGPAPRRVPRGRAGRRRAWASGVGGCRPGAFTASAPPQLQQQRAKPGGEQCRRRCRDQVDLVVGQQVGSSDVLQAPLWRGAEGQWEGGAASPGRWRRGPVSPLLCAPAAGTAPRGGVARWRPPRRGLGPATRPGTWHRAASRGGSRPPRPQRRGAGGRPGSRYRRDHATPLRGVNRGKVRTGVCGGGARATRRTWEVSGARV